MSVKLLLLISAIVIAALTITVIVVSVNNSKQRRKLIKKIEKLEHESVKLSKTKITEPTEPDKTEKKSNESAENKKDINKIKYIDVDNLPLHIDLKYLIITNRNIKQYVPKESSIHSYNGIEPSLVDEFLPINYDAQKEKTPTPKSDGLSYSKLTPDQRCVYLQFLNDPYDSTFDITYVFILFYGLERHLVFGDIGRAAEVIENLRQYHNNRGFLALSFNALTYTCKRNNTFIAFLKREYYYLNLDFTIYYHLKTDKIFPAEAIIRFREYFGFPRNLSSAKFNPVVMQRELENLLESNFGKNITNFPLNKYAGTAMPDLEHLPFPANPSMSKIVNKYIATKHFYNVEPFKTEISDLLKKTYINVMKRYVN